MGVLPAFDAYGLPEERFSTDSFSGTAVPELKDLGKDVAFSFVAGDFDLFKQNSPAAASEDRALAQWITIALITPRGRYIIYPETFGSELHTILGSGMDAEQLSLEVPEMIRSALLFHERIREVDNVRLRMIEERLDVSFEVILDDDAKLTFSGALPSI